MTSFTDKETVAVRCKMIHPGYKVLTNELLALRATLSTAPLCSGTDSCFH